jgi:phosphoglycerate dehydrogenase-like enzyme
MVKPGYAHGKLPGFARPTAGESRMFRLAILDDYQDAARSLVDWGVLGAEVQVERFTDHLPDVDGLAKRLAAFDGVFLMRERTQFPRALIERLPKLRLILTAGMRNVAIDEKAATERGILICGTSMLPYPTAELTWGMILALARAIPHQESELHRGHWQTRYGFGLRGKTLGIVGLGKLGTQVATIGKAFGMDVIAWSQNLTAERAAEAGVRAVSQTDLFESADVVTVHYTLSGRSRGLIGAADLALMKPTAYLVNTSRGPLVDEAALIATLRAHGIAGAGLDVYDFEPLAPKHPFRELDNVVLTPHLGYVTEENLRTIYEQALEDLRAFLAGAPVRTVNELVAR